MNREARWPAVVLGIWSIVVWAGRLRNIAADGDLRTGPAVLAIVFVVGGVTVVVAAWRRAVWLAPAVTSLALTTIAVWVVRATAILLADHDAGFKAVHAGLAAVSIGLAVVALRWAAATLSDRRRAPASGTGSRRRP